MKGLQFSIRGLVRGFWMKRNARVVMAAMLAVALVLALFLFATGTPAVLAQATSTPTNTPTNTPTRTPTNTPTTTPFPVGNNPLIGNLLCRFANVDCVQIRNGGTIHGYATNGKNTFTLNGATGNVSAQSLTLATPLAAGSYVAPTAQPTFAYTAPTAQPTATPYNGSGFKEFVALVALDGTTDITILKNTLGGVPVLTRNSEGNYSLTLSAAFTEDKTVLFSRSVSGGGTDLCTASRNSQNEILITQMQISVNPTPQLVSTPIDDIGVCNLRIEVYP